MTTIPNAEMQEFWNGEGGRRWLNFEDRLTASLQPFGARALEVAGVAADEAVLDIGCGCGPNTLDLAVRVGPYGRVQGVDISDALVAKARANAEAAGAKNVAFDCLDAQTTDLGSDSYDLCFSRFGVMFFDQPVIAFNNMFNALKPGGRLVFACWAKAALNHWVARPLEVVARHVPLPPPPAPDAPGPFSLGDEQRTQDILAQAGFKDIVIEPYTASLVLGDDADEAVRFLMQLAPSGGAINAADPDAETRAAIARDLTGLVAEYQQGARVVSEGVALIVQAAKNG